MSDDTIRIDDFVLDLVRLDEGADKAVAVHSVPFMDGDFTVDLGFSSLTLEAVVLFMDDDFDRHTAFIDHLKKRELFTVEHPDFGVMDCRVKRWSRTRSDVERVAEVSLSLVQHRGLTAAAVSPDITAAVDAAVKTQQEGALASLRAWVRRASATASGVTDTMETAIGTFEAALTEIARPANAITALVDYGADVPGRLLFAAAETMERLAETVSGLRSFPAAFAASFWAGVAALVDAEDAFTPSTAEPNADTIAAVKDAATAGAAAVVAARLAARFAENETGGAEDAPLSATELERAIAVLRDGIMSLSGTPLGRELLTGLKPVADMLAEHVNTVKLQRERIVTRRADAPTHLFLMIHAAGGSVADAGRVLAINPDMTRPHLVTGEVFLHE